MPATNASARWPIPASLLATAALVALFAAIEPAWPLAAVLLVPWLWALDRARSWRGVAAQGLATTVLFTAAVFWWFAIGIGQFTGVGTGLAAAALLLAAPLLQPQILVFALVRHAVGRAHGPLLRALAGAAAWVATEALWPKLLGDTLGHGLQPADALRQAADLGGATGLTVVVLLTNEAIAQAIARRRDCLRAWGLPLAFGTAMLAAVSGYGAWRLAALRVPPAADTAVLRVAMVQASLTDYETRRREQGAYAVVREVLDTHFGLSASALRDHGADVLLWSETVYPTTFGQPRSEDGAAFDAEIQGFVDAMGVPLVFGTYEQDVLGEYNAAVVLEPGRGRLGSYRKTHPFPLTEHVPEWLDGPALRAALPWTGGWRAGDGARVLPLRSGDGREVNVLPLICLDDVHPQLAIDGARLGAQAILGMSNDSWFTEAPLGARLHLAVAAFRSVETGLPQLRVTTNGFSAVIDETGEVLVHTAMGQQAVLTGFLLARDPAPTLMVRWGDWVGRAGLAFLFALALWRGLAALGAHALRPAAAPTVFAVVLMPPTMRLAVIALRAVALAGLVALAYDMATRIGWQVASLGQLRGYGLFVVLPLLLAWGLRRWGRSELRFESAQVVIDRPNERIEIPHAAIASLQAWRLPLPSPGLELVLGSGRRWSMALASPSAAGDAWRGALATGRLAAVAEQRARAHRPRWDHALLKFGLFPLLPALIAFRLHQVIAFGGFFGEWLTYGPAAWFTGLAIWWAAWSLGLMLFAAALRIALEGIAFSASWLAAPTRQTMLREAGEWLLRGLYYVGVPAALVFRLLAG
ncbi:apolipoprotein N-acyltransferase [Silanimonas sp.]|uniref:apolipoprotein N-acyltransferase n=1 Tax=Silanimonas sp. TaxID=1929290 RepID=UPI0022C7B47B|nr:apolipoprotein N-acyltransferase [Silanimonas sp.]MCZ8062677.1 apolipoprotein N-acyltransferase [Silanimonas sp.]